MKMQSVTSSNISAVGYDGDTETLAIRFKAADGMPGNLYEYHKVPHIVHDALMGAESVGKFFAKHVRPLYEHTKVEEARAA